MGDSGPLDSVVLRVSKVTPGANLSAKLTLVDRAGKRILPAFYDDNYVSLLPGESRTIAIRYAAETPTDGPQVELRGWNVAPQVETAGE